MKIVIYSGPGVGERSFSEAARSLAAALPGAILAPIGPKEVRTTNWHATTTLFVMPGGRDLPYCDELDGLGTDSIRAFVENGGKYLGFCAGAYFACGKILFEMGTPNQVSGPRKLSFFDGIGIGAAIEPGTYRYQTEESARAVTISSLNGDPLKVYFDGGCSFQSEDGAAVEPSVLSHYQEENQNAAAIILCQVGKGKALLSGVHPEFSAHAALALRPDLALELMPYEQARQRFLLSLLTTLDLKEMELESVYGRSFAATTNDQP